MAVQKLKGSFRIGHMSSNRGDDQITIELDDKESGIRFLELRLSMEQFGRLVGTNGSVDVDYEVRRKEFIGKKYDSKPGSRQIPADVYRKMMADTSISYDERKKPLQQWLKENAQEEGWFIDTYLSGQKSIVGAGYGDEPVTLNFRYFRYVDPT